MWSVEVSNLVNITSETLVMSQEQEQLNNHWYLNLKDHTGLYIDASTLNDIKINFWIND